MGRDWSLASMTPRAVTGIVAATQPEGGNPWNT
jgi:hypothetical protein